LTDSGKSGPGSVDRLFEALKGGDERGMQEFLPPLRGRLLRLARRVLEEQLAEDVVQETLTTLWEKRDSVTNADHLLRFVFRTFRYKSLNAQYRARREPDRASDTELDRLASNPTTTHPGLVFQTQEFERIVEEAIQACAEENSVWGRVLQLLGEGHSRKEIQRLMGDIPAATVYTRIFRARQRLKEILKADFNIEL